MTVNSNNPFILPGLGQTGEMASNPLFASLEMMRQTFSTLSGANGLAKGLSMQPTLDPVELEKKISELKSVESWLKLNLSMLSSTIQGMEVQLATITTLQQFMSANRDIAKQSWPHTPADSPAPTAPLAPSVPVAPAQAQASEAQASPTAKAPSPDGSNAEVAQAWWNMLTQQFGQLAAATTASMAAAPGGKTAEVATAAHAVKKEKSAVKKTPSRTRSVSKKPVTRSAAKK
jgi:hypothetical protein